MPIMKFTDGMMINTDGPYRVIRQSDGFYVTGHGFLCPVDSQEEGDKLIADLKEDNPARE